MQIDPTSVAAVPNLRWNVDELIDFMESCLLRNPRDLKLHGLKTSDVLTKTDKWLDKANKPSGMMTLESIAAGVAVPALDELVSQANRRLRRSRQLVPLESLRAQDARCLMWLARRPGNNLNEKLTKDRRLMGVVRELSFDVLENRVAHQTAQMLHKLLGSEEMKWDRALTRKTRSSCRRMIELAAASGIRGLAYAPAPNNALLKDRKYRRIWLAYRWLLARDEFRQLVGDNLCRSTAEALVLLAASQAGKLGFEVADGAMHTNSRPSARCSWIKDQNMHWVRFGTNVMELLDVSLEEVDGQSQSSMCWRTYRSEDDKVSELQVRQMILVPAIRNGRLEVFISGDNVEALAPLANGELDLHNLADLLSERLSLWNGSKTVPHRSSIGSQQSTRKVLRFTGDQLRTGNQSLGCYCGALSTESQYGMDSVNLHGSGLRIRKVLGLKGTIGHGRITPGLLSRALSRPGGVGAAFAELVQAAEGEDNERTLEAIAVPAALPFGFEVSIRAALRPSAGDSWLVPQPVASAISAIWGTQPIPLPQLDDFVCSVDLDGERVDASLLRWTEIPSPTRQEKSPGWLHFREIREPSQLGPRAINLLHKVLLSSITSADLPNAHIRKACTQALHQVGLEQLWQLLLDPDTNVEAWLLTDTNHPAHLHIKHDVALKETKDWLTRSVIPWLDQRIGFWGSKEKTVHTIVLNGVMFGVTELRQSLEEWITTRSLSHYSILDGDQVSNGLEIFLERQSSDQTTWSEHLPVLEILGFNTRNQTEWLRMFDEDASVSPGSKVLRGPTHTFVTDKRIFSVPMRCDGERGRQDPSVRIPDACPLPLAVEVQAHYDLGRAGLTLAVRSKEAGVMTEVAMEWGSTGPTPEEAQQLQVYESPIDQSEIEGMNQRLRNAMEQFLEGNGRQNELRTAIDSVARKLGASLRHAESIAWSRVGQDEILKLAGRLCWLHRTGSADYHSVLFSAPRPRREFTAGTANTRQRICLESTALQVSITSALGKMRAAAPYGLVDWCLQAAAEEQDQSLRHECIRCLGRTFGPEDNPTRGRVLDAYDRFFFEVQSNALKHPEDRSIWYWSLHAALSYSAASVQKFGLERIIAILESLRYDIEQLAAKPESADPALLRNLLAAMLAARHGTRLEHGMEQLGPKSPCATRLAESLNTASHQFSAAWDEKRMASITILGFLDDGTGESSFRSSTPISQVGEIWEGKVKALLRQMTESD